MASTSSSSFTIPQFKYDVFLNFSEDTYSNFTHNLYSALHREGIVTFIDYDGLRKGEQISHSLLKAIEESRLSIIIFSKDYASSEWCLDQLAKILQCKKMNGQMVIPVFYHIKPSHVRNQTGSFQDALLKHEKHFKEMPEKVNEWRNDLTEAANLSGYDSSLIKPEAKLVDEIVLDILKKLGNTSSSSGHEDLVGLESRITQVKTLLQIGSSNFQSIGIWGVGGVGKTTIARVIFDQISSEFEGSYFIANVRESSEQGELFRLREQVISQILDENNITINTRNIPQNIQKMIRCKKLFIVLDDVSTFNQLEILLGGLDSFGPGSRVVITSRDKHTLHNCGVESIFEVENLNNSEALQLFCRYAFKQNCPSEDHMVLSKRVIDYAKGNPLALKVLGSSFYGKGLDKWKSGMRRLKASQNSNIFTVLKISYDGLNSEEKNIFLDIAFFFRGWDKDRAITLLNGWNFSAYIGLCILVDKSLITISNNNILDMHDLLKEMCWEIVRQESTHRASHRSRLHNYRDVFDVLKNNTGAETLEGMVLDMSQIKDVHLSPDAFANMHNLRFLKFDVPHYQLFEDFANVCKVHLPHGLNYISEELRYLHWDGYPSKTLPPNFDPENLIELILPYSNLERLWEGTLDARKLKLIDLHHSPHLARIPDLSLAPGLEIIKLEDCKSLVDVPSCIRFLNNLRILSLSGCESLKSFPSNIYFESLIVLDLFKCINLTEFPHVGGSIENLYLGGTAIEEVPSSVDCLTELRLLDLEDCTRLKSISTSICKLKSLSHLNLRNCSKLQTFPEIFEKMERLKDLSLSGATAIKRIPTSIEHLNGLCWLRLRDCKNLETIPNSMCYLTSLVEIDLYGCSKVDRLPENLLYLESLNIRGTAVSQLPSSISSWKKIKYLDCSGCRGLVLSPLPSSLTQIELSFCNLTKIPEDLGCISSLETLNLSGNYFESLPSSIKQLSHLSHLDLSDCIMLRSLSELPTCLRFLEAKNCKVLQSLPEPLSCLQELDASELENLYDQNWITVEFIFTNCLNLNQEKYNNVVANVASLQLFYEKVYKRTIAMSFILPGSEIPHGFNYQSPGSSIIVEFPRISSNKSCIGFALCAVIALEEAYCGDDLLVNFFYEFQTDDCAPTNFTQHSSIRGMKKMLIKSDHIVLAYEPVVLKIKGGYKITFKFSTREHFPNRPINGCKVKCCGVCPLYGIQADTSGSG